MRLDSNIRIKKGFWWFIPLLSKYTANAIYPNIYLPEEVYINLESDNPKPRYVGTLIHEQSHIKRQKEVGWLKWGMRYVFSSSFRYQEELAAIKEQVNYLRKQGVEYDVEKSARYLSGPLYLWCVSYEKAKEDLGSI